ncbi:MAG: hypothetical protein HY651_13360 [Acidobacteria bacterium]|nr:hypothetical protein [Acidobacteriota bacterium]
MLCSTAAAQVPGPVVNINAFDPNNPLQKQLEVDAAANPNNPSHIFAGYIDYRTAINDNLTNSSLPRIISQAWCGYSFSTNGGRTWKSASYNAANDTWKSFLVPGFLGNTGTEPDGGNSPILGSDTCGDPVVAWDTSGHAYFMGLAVRPDGINFLFVARFLDPDDGTGRLIYEKTVVIESGNPSGIGQDLDKPSLLFVPDPASSDSNPAAGTLYACGTFFDGSSQQGTKVICQYSSTAGTSFTFSKPNQPNQTKLNQNVSTNNGTAITPSTYPDGTPDGGVYVFWRSFEKSDNGYWFVKLGKDGNANAPTRAVGGAGFYPYDAPPLSELARSNAFPTVGTDARGRILLAFQAYSDTSGRMAAPSFINTPRIFLTYFNGTSWSEPRAVDYGPHGNTFQFMPRLAVGGGGVFQILYYDARNDNNGLGGSLNFVSGWGYFPTGRTRRFDARVVQGEFKNVNGTPTLSFNPSAQVSQYSISSANGQIVDRPGGCAGSCPAVLLPNLPIARGGTVPFIGDYIALAPAVPLLRNSANLSGPAWRFANQAGDPESFLAFFASTQDVGFPFNPLTASRDINGAWSDFTPATLAGGNSCANPWSRDSNIYFSAITPGIVASWSGTSGRVNVSGIGTIPPQFNVTAENRSDHDGFFRLTILDVPTPPPPAPPTADDWSFVQTLHPPPAAVPPDEPKQVETQILRNSSISVPVYYRFWDSIPTKPVAVEVQEINSICVPPNAPPNCGVVLNGGLKTKVTYSLNNAQINNAQFNNAQINNAQINNAQFNNVQFNNQSPSNAQINNAQINNAQINNSLVPDQDVTWTVTGTGVLPNPVNITTNASEGDSLLDQGYQFQLLIYATQDNPGVVGCTVVPTSTDVVISNLAITNARINNAQINNAQINNAQFNNTAISDPLVSNATFVVNSGEEVNITLRSFAPTEGTTSPLTLSSLFQLSSVGVVDSPGCVGPPDLDDPLNCRNVGQAVFSTAAHPDGTSSSSFFDETPPVITHSVAGTGGSNGWYRSNVTVTWTVSDLQSGITSITGCGDPITHSATISTEGTTTLPCSATNGKELSSSDPVTIKIDKTAPTITATISPAADTITGWYNATTGPPTVQFQCSDSGSGLAPGACPANVTLSDGANQSVSRSVSDIAGNTATATVSGINVDTTPPIITATISPTSPAPTGWYNATTGKPTISFVCEDPVPGSGLATPCPATVTLNDGVYEPFSRSVSDVAGNTGTVTLNIKVDTTLPSITITAPANYTGLPLLPPPAPTPAGIYFLNASVASNYTCADTGGSGIDTCSGPVSNGSNFSTYTVASNPISFIVTAKDKAGNSASQTNTYFVLYKFVLTPPKTPARLGSAVPLVWQLTDANGVILPVDMNSLVRLWSVSNGTQTPCPSTLPANWIQTRKLLYSPATGATGGSDFRFLTASKSYKFNWDTSTEVPNAGCYTVVFQLKDNSTGPNANPALAYAVLEPKLLKLTAVQLK